MGEPFEDLYRELPHNGWPPAEPAQPPTDLDVLLTAVVNTITTATYYDAVRRTDVRTRPENRPAGADELRQAASRSAKAAENTLLDAVADVYGHDRAMELIPQLSRARYWTAERGELDYRALPVAVPAEVAAEQRRLVEAEELWVTVTDREDR